MIIYSLVSNGKVILADTEEPKGTLKALVKQILEKLPDDATETRKMSYSHDDVTFHILTVKNMVYLCIAQEEFGVRKPFAFLEDCKGRFMTQYGDKGTTIKKKRYYDRDFGRVLEKQMDYYSRSAEADKLVEVQSALAEVRSAMDRNVEQVLSRGENLSELLDKTEDLQAQAKDFKENANELKWAFIWKNIMWYLMIFLALAGIGYFIASKACGGFSLPECRSQDKGGAGAGSGSGSVAGSGSATGSGSGSAAGSGSGSGS